MKAKLKSLVDQTIVITGESSGIGLSTARRAAERGARVVLSSRNGPELEKIVEGIRSKGGRAVHAVTDVSKREDLDRLAEEAVEAFGGFDTWVNNAGLGIFGRLDRVSDDDYRRATASTPMRRSTRWPRPRWWRPGSPASRSWRARRAAPDPSCQDSFT